MRRVSVAPAARRNLRDGWAGGGRSGRCRARAVRGRRSSGAQVARVRVRRAYREIADGRLRIVDARLRDGSTCSRSGRWRLDDVGEAVSGGPRRYQAAECQHGWHLARVASPAGAGRSLRGRRQPGWQDPATPRSRRRSNGGFGWRREHRCRRPCQSRWQRTRFGPGHASLAGISGGMPGTLARTGREPRVSLSGPAPGSHAGQRARPAGPRHRRRPTLGPARPGRPEGCGQVLRSRRPRAGTSYGARPRRPGGRDARARDDPTGMRRRAWRP